MVAGPGIAGTAVANAGLFGIDFFDIFDDDKKSDMHHPRPGTEVNVQSARTTAGVAAAEAPKAKIGSLPESVSAAETAETRSFASVPENVSIAESAAGGGGGGMAGTNSAIRAGNLPSVSTAPVTRSVVIRGTPRSAPSAGDPVLAVLPPALPETPAVVPLAAPPQDPPEPEGRPAPAAPPAAPSPTAPQGKDPLASGDSEVARVPDSFRVGYMAYLRAANTGDLVAAALPGVAGIAGFTLVGAYAGYRQARALHKALLAPAPTSILL
jgi:hypothetical protein